LRSRYSKQYGCGTQSTAGGLEGRNEHAGFSRFGRRIKRAVDVGTAIKMRQLRRQREADGDRSGGLGHKSLLGSRLSPAAPVVSLVIDCPNQFTTAGLVECRPSNSHGRYIMSISRRIRPWLSPSTQRRCRSYLAPPFLLDQYTPRYSLISSTDASKKRSEAYSHLRNCNLCPRLCGVNRFEKTGVCLIGAETVKVSTIAPHFGEGWLTIRR